MDGRILAGVGALARETVEGADDLERRLRYRFLEVTAGGRYRSADRDGAGHAIPEPHDARALVERGDIRLEVCGERFLSGDLLESAGHFAEGLCPAGRRVREEKDV